MRNITVDFVTNIITISKAFYEESKEYGSNAYIEMEHLKRDNPTMRIAVRTCKRSSRTKNKSKWLTYRYMRKFISIMDKDSLEEFDNIMIYYESFYTDNAKVYINVRDWFLEKYPEHEKMIAVAADKESDKNMERVPRQAA